jgi:hypothetical protein
MPGQFAVSPKPAWHRSSLVNRVAFPHAAEMTLAGNLEAIRNKIEAACARTQRDLASVTLLPVSKSQSPDAVRALAELGLNQFGESKVQEAKTVPTFPWVHDHLQTYKYRDAVHFENDSKRGQSLAEKSTNAPGRCQNDAFSWKSTSLKPASSAIHQIGC